MNNNISIEKVQHTLVPPDKKKLFSKSYFIFLNNYFDKTFGKT